VLEAAVDRNHLAGTDEQQVTRPHGRERRRRELTVLVTTRRPWCTGEEGTKLALGSTRRSLLKHPTRAEHHGDQRARNVLTDDESSCEREDGQHIDAGTTNAQTGHHPDHRGDEPEHGGRGPQCIGHIVHAEYPRSDTRDQTGRGDADEDLGSQERSTRALPRLRGHQSPLVARCCSSDHG
jgi:hypothetical protein